MTYLKLCIIGKYPPIQGGVSCQMYWLARCLAELGNQVHFITNADEVELDYRMYIPEQEHSKLECSFENGGYVKLHTTHEVQQARYIPYSNPFVSKLASLAVDVVTRYDCTFIYTSYLEPYGLAGSLVAHWTGIAYSVQHAGSDIGRLAQLEDRHSVYFRIIKNADLVVTTRTVARSLIADGIEYEKLFFGMPRYLDRKLFTNNGPVLDIAALLDEVNNTQYASPLTSKSRFDPSKPTIGIYGKPGKYKGTSELIQALSKLRKQGKDFNFVALCGVAGKRIEEFQKEVRYNQLNDCTYLLPYIPHWLVPNFIRACTAVCFLENRFPIPIHRPQVPYEVLACSCCLILSQEILNKQPDKQKLLDKENYLLIPDPQDISYLASTLGLIVDNPQYAQEIGKNTNFLHQEIENINNIYKNLLERINELSFYKKEKNLMLADFQNLLINLYTNTSFRQLLKSDFSQSLQGYNLNQKEIEALSQLSHIKPQIENFAEHLYSKKFRFFWKQFPTIIKFFSELEADIFKYFKSNYDYQNRNWMEDIKYFVNLLEDFHKTYIYQIHESFMDVIKYDYLVFRASLYPLPHESLKTINNFDIKLVNTNKKEIKNIDKILLFKSPDVLIDRFKYDIHSLDKLSSLNQLHHQQCYLAFVPSLQAANADFYHLSPSLGYIVEKANKPTYMSQLISKAASFHNLTIIPQNFHDACMYGIQDLYEKGILIESNSR